MMVFCLTFRTYLMTASASARTDRPMSPSSSWPCCWGDAPTCGYSCPAMQRRHLPHGSTAASSEKTPTALVLTRQNLAPITGSSREALKGGYAIDDCEGTPEVILIASGSEVELAVKAKAELEAEGTKVRVVSMPCMELFEEQSAEYREAVLPKAEERESPSKRFPISDGENMWAWTAHMCA